MELDVFAQDFIEDPFPAYRRLRNDQPIWWSDDMQAWLVSRYRDVKQLLNDDRVTPDQKEWAGYPKLLQVSDEIPNVLWALEQTLLLRSGAEHARLRKLSSQAFGPAGCARIASETTAVVRKVIAGFAGRREIDLVADYAIPVRIQVMSQLFGAGFTAQDEEFLVHGTNAALGFLEPTTDPQALRRNEEALGRFRRFVDDVVDRALETDHPSITRDLFHAAAGAPKHTRGSVVSLVFSFLLAGTEANGSLITMGILSLLEHPDQLRLLLREPHRFEEAIEEVLRYRNFTKFLPRYVTRDFEFHGRPLRRGQVVLLLFQSAFRDPDVFVDADRFDVTRSHGEELPFGYGTHRCVGERMAHIEGAIALREFFEHHPRAALREPNPSWTRHHMLVAVPRSIAVVPVVLNSSECPD